MLPEDKSKNIEENLLNAIITKPNPIFIGENKDATFTLKADNSTGEISEYLWDFTDNWNKQPFKEKEKGMEIEKTYTETGKYWFALRVVDENGNHAQNETYLSINYREDYTDSVNNGETNNHSFPVSDWGTQQVYVILSYPKGGTPNNNLSLTLYDNNDEQVDKQNKYKEQREENGKIVEEIILPLQEVQFHKSGKWNAEIKNNNDSILGQDVQYDLLIEVIYEEEAIHN